MRDKNLKKLLIKTKKGVFSHQIGNHSSKFKGDGYDFVELREYEEGEDIRKIDWVISAKQRKPYVKVFHTQRELHVVIAPLLSGSTFFGTQKLKSELITEICAVLGYACTARGDSFSSYLLNDSITPVTHTSKKIVNVEKMVEKLYHYNPVNKQMNYTLLQKQFFSKIQSRSVVFLIGDFFQMEDLNLKLLGSKHEVVVIIVRDSFEEKPKPVGNVNFTDPQTGFVFDGSANESTIKNYIKNVKKNDMVLFEHLKKEGIEFTKIYTHENYFVKLLKLFN